MEMAPVLEFMIGLALACHLLCVNVAMSGPLVCVWLECRALRRNDKSSDEIGQDLASFSLITLLAGSLIGSLMLLLFWAVGDTEFFAVATQLRSKIWSAVWEILFSIVCLVAYIAWWRYSPRGTLSARLGHRLLAVSAATNLMYHFPPLFTLMAELKFNVNNGAEPPSIDAAAYRSMIFTPTVCAHTIHFWLASVATTAVAVIMQALNIGWPGRKDRLNPRLAVYVARLALAASVLQIPVGLWLLVTLRSVQQSRILGDDIACAALFASALAAALALLHHLTSISMGDTARRTAVRTLGLLLLVVWLMSGTLVRARKPLDADNHTSNAGYFSGSTGSFPFSIRSP